MNYEIQDIHEIQRSKIVNTDLKNPKKLLKSEKSHNFRPESNLKKLTNSTLYKSRFEVFLNKS